MDKKKMKLWEVKRMRKYTLMIPLIANAYAQIEAENENEAWEKGQKLYDEGKIDLMGFDNEPIDMWEIEVTESCKN